MKRHLIRYALFPLAVMAFAAAAVPAAAGTIAGKVKVNGLRSPANILVYLSKAPGDVPDAGKAKFVMDQQNLTFSPHILPIPVGATIAFPNHDKVDHNVFSLSRTQPFNLGSYKPGQVKTVRFDKPGIIELRCDVHAEMLAYIMVMKNPYFAVTDSDGRFQIPDPRWTSRAGLKTPPPLPAGRYTVKAWHEKLRTGKASAAVPAEGEVSVELNLRRGPASSVLYK